MFEEENMRAHHLIKDKKVPKKIKKCQIEQELLPYMSIFEENN